MWYGEIRAGRIKMSEATKKSFVHWANNHEEGHVVIQEHLPKRSHSQNAYYWVYLGVISAETGEVATALHAYYKQLFLPPVIATVFGKEIEVQRSTTELNKQEFGEYLERICADCGIPLPNPEDAGYISNYKPYKKV